MRRLAGMVVAVAAAAWAAGAEAATVAHKGGVWAVTPDLGGVCFADTPTPGGGALTLVGLNGRVSFSLKTAKRIFLGRRAIVQMEDYGFGFKPGLGPNGAYLFMDAVMEDSTVAELRAARQFRVMIDDRTQADLALAKSGFPEVLAAVIACSKGERGWWGEGAVDGAYGSLAEIHALSQQRSRTF